MNAVLVLACLLTTACTGSPLAPSAPFTLRVLDVQTEQPISGVLVSTDRFHGTTGPDGRVLLPLTVDAVTQVDLQASGYRDRHEPFLPHSANAVETTVTLTPIS